MKALRAADRRLGEKIRRQISRARRAARGARRRPGAQHPDHRVRDRRTPRAAGTHRRNIRPPRRCVRATQICGCCWSIHSSRSLADRHETSDFEFAACCMHPHRLCGRARRRQISFAHGKGCRPPASSPSPMCRWSTSARRGRAAPEGRRAVADQIAEACGRVGFLYVANHRIAAARRLMPSSRPRPTSTTCRSTPKMAVCDVAQARCAGARATCTA